jgi:hypothetical protein
MLAWAIDYEEKDICRLKRCLRDFKTKDHLCLLPDLLSFELFFQNGLSCPLVLGLGSLSLFLFSSFGWASHFFLYFYFIIILLIFFLDPLDFSSCPQALFGHFQTLRFFLCLSHLPPSVGCDPSRGYFQKTLPGSKGDCKWYISVLWKDYQRWPFFISNACI